MWLLNIYPFVYIKLLFFTIITELINKTNLGNRNTEENKNLHFFHTMCCKKKLLEELDEQSILNKESSPCYDKKAILKMPLN